MATNLRLSRSAADALRKASRQSGRSQQELLREAIDRYLGLDPRDTDRDRAVAARVVQPPTPFQDVTPSLSLKEGLTTADLLNRDDR